MLDSSGNSPESSRGSTIATATTTYPIVGGNSYDHVRCFERQQSRMMRERMWEDRARPHKSWSKIMLEVLIGLIGICGLIAFMASLPAIADLLYGRT